MSSTDERFTVKPGELFDMEKKTSKPKRNTHAIGFNDEEYALITEKARKAELIPRQYLYFLAKADKQ
jgi:predicted branched-subunit amino acid permease